jgi:LuxR family transcriptional regulator of csgAB operon
LEKQAQPDKSSTNQIYIFGLLRLQNELMAWFLQHSTGLMTANASISELEALLDETKDQKCIILLDYLSDDPTNLWPKIRKFANSGAHQNMIALFNVDPNQQIGNDLVKHGVRGIFYEDDPLPNISKGVQTILKGEWWFTRETLVKCLVDSKEAGRVVDGTQIFLTSREKEILIMIASGAPNLQIAAELCISPNTVKTHIYNIYNKLNVPNRLQAVLWAAKNL